MRGTYRGNVGLHKKVYDMVTITTRVVYNRVGAGAVLKMDRPRSFSWAGARYERGSWEGIYRNNGKFGIRHFRLKLH
jgi:hypothetical protein